MRNGIALLRSPSPRLSSGSSYTVNTAGSSYPQGTALRRPSPNQVQRVAAPRTQRQPLETTCAPEDNIILHCFDSILSALSNTTRFIAQGHEDQSVGSCIEKLRQEAERLHLWGKGHSIKSRNLDVWLQPFPDIRFAVLCRLYELGTAMKHLHGVFIQDSTTHFALETNHLEVDLKPVLLVLRENKQDIIDYSLPKSENTSDLSGPLEDIRVLIDCLMDLSLAIEDCLATSNGPLPQRPSQEELIDPVIQKDKQGTSVGTTSQKADKGKLQAPDTQDKCKKEAAFGTRVSSYRGAFTTYPASTTSTHNTPYFDTIGEEQHMYQDPPAHAYSLPCEFYAIGGCETFFEYNDRNAWIEHILVDHLQDKLPQKADCWFCTTYSFNVKDPRVHGDRRLNFEYRMNHIHRHIGEGKGASDMMPDFHMLDHLLKHKLISEGRYNEVRRWRGLPTPLGPLPHDHLKDFGKPDFVLPQRTIQAERSNMVQIDHNKEERQWKKDKKKR
ncbi:hypothetical protein F4806DRAFT_454893 [Annulohypoxylon nitens]|nr:hypothetical protein F4806DRAFT_454893 [Annulohypoxylon nitens]